MLHVASVCNDVPGLVLVTVFMFFGRFRVLVRFGYPPLSLQRADLEPFLNVGIGQYSYGVYIVMAYIVMATLR